MSPREQCHSRFPVASYEADAFGKLSLFALFNRFQELAGVHADRLHVGHEQLQKSNLVWVLSRIGVRILSLPGWGDVVQLVTWPRGIDRLFAVRDFSLTSETGETLILATSAWLLLDVDTNRPRRIESLPIDLHFPEAPEAVLKTPEKIQMPEGLQAVGERPVRFSDIDVNQHVNNAQYAKWIGDCFPLEHYRARRMTSIQINYLEETLLGDQVVLSRAPEGTSADEYFLEGVSRNKGSRVFQARVTWGDR